MVRKHIVLKSKGKVVPVLN